METKTKARVAKLILDKADFKSKAYNQRQKKKGPSNSISRYFSEETQNTKLKRHIYPHMFIAALFTIAKIWTQTKCTSIDEWIKKQCTV